MKIRLSFLALASLFSIFFSCADEQVVASSKPITNYTRTFNDLNDRHKAAAEQIGITPIASRKQAQKMGRKLVEIETNKYFEVAKLTHSLPYLVPKANDLLTNIAKDFQRQLKNKDLPAYKIRVTSILRTAEDINKLKRRNTNSSSNSAHAHATTFDLSYVRFVKVKESSKEVSDIILKRTLAEVIQGYREKQSCYVKYEVKQGCFHITAR